MGPFSQRPLVLSLVDPFRTLLWNLPRLFFIFFFRGLSLCQVSIIYPTTSHLPLPSPPFQALPPPTTLYLPLRALPRRPFFPLPPRPHAFDMHFILYCLVHRSPVFLYMYISAVFSSLLPFALLYTQVMTIYLLIYSPPP